MPNTSTFDPLKNFRFQVKFGTITVAGVSKISGLKRTTEVVSHREGGDPTTPRHTPGITKYEPITFERGVSKDKQFENWANKIYNYDDGAGVVNLSGYKINLSIEILDGGGIAVARYNVYDAWVSEFNAMTELDANANAVMFETVVVQNEGWTREL